MSTISTTAENAANKENYEHAQSTIDKVLEKVATLKETEANAELKRQVEQLDEAYENAIRLRMLRINTLQAHCDDRDAEIVALRQKAKRLSQSKKCALAGAAIAAAVAFISAVYTVLPQATLAAAQAALAYAQAALHFTTQSPWGAAAASCVVTIAAPRLLRSFWG